MKETALITGASSGIGLDLARLFAKDGHDVILVARSEGKLREVAAGLERDFGVTAHCPGPTETGFAAVADMTTTRLFNIAKPMSSAEVARAGYEAMKRGRRVVIPGLKNKLLTQSIRVSPRRMVTTIVRKLQESRQ